MVCFKQINRRFFNSFLFSVKERTYSFWNFILQNINDFQNPLFRPQSTYASEVLLPIINSQTLKYIRYKFQFQVIVEFILDFG
jgi:hypothetical protein